MEAITQPILIQYLILAVVLVIAIWFHEYAHAWVSYVLGDPTPKLQWRLTPNPLKHIDPLGFLMIFLIHFGWGKPVEVNPMYYKNKLRDELLVALAGPFSNFLMAFIGSFLYVLFAKFWWLDPLIQLFFYRFIFINIALAIFNLLPIYPLDWYRIVKFLNPSWWYFMEKNALAFTIILLVLVFLPWNLIWKVISVTVEPIMSFMLYIFNILL